MFTRFRQFTCALCGKIFELLRSQSRAFTKSGRKTGRGRFCSNDCYDKHRAHARALNFREFQCEVCKTPFRRYRPGSVQGPVRFCSVPCMAKSNSVGDKTCPTCGVPFPIIDANGHSKKFCSKKCYTAVQSKMMLGIPIEQNPDSGIERVRTKRPGSRKVRESLVVQVCERDAWRCGICRKKVNPEFKWPHPLSKSVDHIVPVSNGGTSDLINLRLAHLRCNTKRGNFDPAQSRLYG